ncbi:hypothetical protein D3C84_1242810 [compost metagenome]
MRVDLGLDEVLIQLVFALAGHAHEVSSELQGLGVGLAHVAGCQGQDRMLGGVVGPGLGGSLGRTALLDQSRTEGN